MDRDYQEWSAIARAAEKKWKILIIIFVFTLTCVISISFYIHHLESAFLNNIQFYMSEIADHDTKSVDQEIWNQWQRLETVGRKLELERYSDITGVQRFLNLESAATGFENLSLIDENGYSYEANYLIEDRSKEAWIRQLFEQDGPYVMRCRRRNNYIAVYNELMYGVPIEPVKVGDVTFVGIVGEYQVNTVKDSLLANFFDGEGLAQVVELDGTIITTDIKQNSEPMNNLLNQFNDKETRELISEKLAAGKSFYTLYEYDGERYIMSARPLTNANWMLVVTVPYWVASSQSAAILKMTAYLLTFICAVIGVVFIFSFISYKRTLVLKNSSEIFYRERLFDLLTNHTDDVFIIENAVTGRRNFISENVKRILGIEEPPETNAITAMLEEASNGELSEGIRRLNGSKVKENSPEHEHFEMEMEWTMPTDGSKKWIHLSLYRAIADFMKEEEACLIAVISDYTTVKQNRTELEAAIKKAQEAAESKSLFLSNMSHEMRTPLNGIVGCMRIIKDNLDNTALLQEYLKKAESTADYMVSLTNDILDMSKIESHKLTLEERKVSIRQISFNMETMFRSQMTAKGIRFAIELEEPLWIIRADEVRIQQILVNLLSNAQKFTNPGGTVVLKIRQLQEAEDRVKTGIVVSDTGIGMSREFSERIFKPFEQERLDTARLHGGTGLGLAISSELVHLMQGTITVESELGKGSTFTVEFTCEALSLDLADGEKEREESAEKELSLVGKKILVAEDNELNREILCSLLEELGAEIRVAENGKEAVLIFQQSSPGEIDGILMDMQMPVMDGCTAAQRIRKMEREDAKRVVILACTANAFQDDIERVKAAGMNDHLAKPLDVTKVVSRLYDYWEGRI